MAGVKKSVRPKLTPEVVINKLDALTGPSFRALCTIDDPALWLQRLMRLYQGWADSVFPQLPFEVFLKRLENMSSLAAIKHATFELMRKRRREEDEEEEQARLERLEGADVELRFDDPPVEQLHAAGAEAAANDAADAVTDVASATKKAHVLDAVDDDDLVLIF